MAEAHVLQESKPGADILLDLPRNLPLLFRKLRLQLFEEKNALGDRQNCVHSSELYIRASNCSFVKG